jgi:predicted ATPase
MLSSLSIQSFRRLSHFVINDIGSVGVFFGPNGVGKTSVMDALWLLRDCFDRDVEEALSLRGGGTGLASQDSGSLGPGITLETHHRQYSISFGGVKSRLNNQPAENLYDTTTETQICLLKRSAFDNFFEARMPESSKSSVTLRNPYDLALKLYLDSTPSDYDSQVIGTLLDRLTYLRQANLKLSELRSGVSLLSPRLSLQHDGRNLWSVLRNLHDRQAVDKTYGMIMHWMQRAFPDVTGLSFTQSGTNSVYVEFVLNGLRNPVPPEHAADGFVHFLLLLVALFSDGFVPKIVMLDEPETSLHPWALYVLAEVIQDVAKFRGRQVLVSTHSPVLLSQFPEEALYVMLPKDDGSASVQRVSEITENRDLLDQYTAGALYMAQLIGEQSQEPMATLVSNDEK